MEKVTDQRLLDQLNEPTQFSKVEDPNILARLNGIEAPATPLQYRLKKAR
jgi:hypothetical protein